MLPQKNKKELYEEVTALFKLARTHQEIQTDSWEVLEKGHGRIEKRTCACINAAPWLEHVLSERTKFNIITQISSSGEKKRKIYI